MFRELNSGVLASESSFQCDTEAIVDEETEVFGEARQSLVQFLTIEQENRISDARTLSRGVIGGVREESGLMDDSHLTT